ncbi:MAG: hypothetical protein ACHQIK_17185 [Candidatus Acidiferrales bacterium]
MSTAETLIAAPVEAPAILPVVEPKPAPGEAPVSPNAETDAALAAKAEERKKKRGGAQARIHELTAKNAKLEEERAKDRAELEKQLEGQKQARANDKRPTREQYIDEAEFAHMVAEWVIRQQEKIQPKPAAVAPAPKIDSAPAPVELSPQFVQARQQEFDGFLESGQKFISRNPDFHETLEKAAKRGLRLDNGAMLTIIRLKAPEVAYYLARPENDSASRRFMQLTPFDQSLEVARLAERLAVNPSDFVSNAGHPGTRLNGGARTDVRPDEMSTDDYLRRRDEEIRTGQRRGLRRRR